MNVKLRVTLNEDSSIDVINDTFDLEFSDIVVMPTMFSFLKSIGKEFNVTLSDHVPNVDYAMPLRFYMRFVRPLETNADYDAVIFGLSESFQSLKACLNGFCAITGIAPEKLKFELKNYIYVTFTNIKPSVL